MPINIVTKFSYDWIRIRIRAHTRQVSIVTKFGEEPIRIVWVIVWTRKGDGDAADADADATDADTDAMSNTYSVSWLCQAHKKCGKLNFYDILSPKRAITHSLFDGMWRNLISGSSIQIHVQNFSSIPKVMTKKMRKTEFLRFSKSKKRHNSFKIGRN